MYPEANCRFTPSHEWVFVTGDVATVGISNHAQKEISDIVFIELPKMVANAELRCSTVSFDSLVCNWPAKSLMPTN